MIFIKYDEYGNISQTQNITESIGQNSLKANTLYIAFPNVVKSHISMIKEYKCYITFERSDGIKISDLPCTPVIKTIDGIEYFGYLYSFSSKQVTACAGSLIVSPRLFSIDSDGEETIAVIGANQTLNVSPSVVESEVVSNLSEAEKNALVDMIQNQHIMWLEKKYNNYSAIEVFRSLLENSMSDGIYVSFDRKRLFIYERTTESICFGEFIKNGIVKNETGIYKYDNEENFEYIKIDDLKTGNLSDLPFTANSIVEALNKIIDGTELVGNAISADYAETAYNAYRDSENNLITTYYASKSALSQANKEIANLKEALYGYVLDSTDVEINSVIPSTVTVNSTQYNLVDNVYGLIKEVKGNTIKSENLLILEDKAETTTNGITYSIKDGVIYLNGTSTQITSFQVTESIFLNGDYVLSYFNNFETNQANLRLTSELYWTYYQLNRNIKFSTTNTQTDAITINIAGGVTFTNAIIKPMLVKGTTAPTEFSKGFNGLKSITYNGTKIVGANLLNIADVSETTTNGITYSIKDGVIYLNGTSTQITSFQVTESIFLNGDYVLSYFNNFETNQANLRLTSELYWTYYQLNRNIKFSTTNTQTDAITINIAGGVTFTNAIIKPMLVKGNVAPTKFKPFRETTILNNFDEPIFLRGVGSAKDKLVITKNEDNEFYTATNVFNTGYIRLGSMNWSIDSGGRFTAPIPNCIFRSGRTEDVLCETYSYSGTTSNDKTCFHSDAKLYVYDSDYTDVKSFKNAINDVWMLYELATPTTEVLTTTLIDSDVMPLLELGGTVEIVGEDGELGSTVVEMVYRLSNTGV